MPASPEDPVLTPDDIVTAVTEAPTREAAKMVMEGVRAGDVLAATCDLLHVDPAGRGKAWQRIAIVAAARA